MIGVVDPRVYWTYLSYTGSGVAVFIVVAVFVMYAFHSGQDIWMTVWLRHVTVGNSSGGGNGSSGGGNSSSAAATTLIDESWFSTAATGNDSWIPLEKSTDELIFYLG